MEGKSGTIIGVIVAAVLVIGGVVLFTGNDDSTTETTTNNNNSSQQSQTETTEEETSSNIVELAQATDSLSTLVAAVVEADLVGTLSSAGPFTVFAPTNDAFAALLSDLGVTAEELLAREDLGDILTYHVVAGEARAADLSDGQVLTTVQGGTLTVGISGGTVTLTDANGGVATVAAADVEASNGVVHVIDAVVLP